jgi:hypothetical protein
VKQRKGGQPGVEPRGEEVGARRAGGGGHHGRQAGPGYSARQHGQRVGC